MDKNILSKLPRDKINISNRSYIKMDKFLSFLNVEVTRSKEHLGSDTGWTQLLGENDLIIRGGVVNRIEYLDSIQYKRKLSDPYSNYVNPFFIFELLNEEGKEFFFDFYKEDIKELKKDADKKVKEAEAYLDSVLDTIGEIVLKLI